MTDDQDISEMDIRLSAALELLASARRDLEHEIVLMRLDDHERRIRALEEKSD